MSGMKVVNDAGLEASAETEALQSRSETALVGKDDLERIAGIFRAFGEPTRLGLLQALCRSDRPMNVGELVELSGTSQANVSKHLKVLHEAAVLTRARVGNKTLYGVQDRVVIELLNAVCEKLNREAKQVTKVEFSI